MTHIFLIQNLPVENRSSPMIYDLKPYFWLTFTVNDFLILLKNLTWKTFCVKNWSAFRSGRICSHNPTRILPQIESTALSPPKLWTHSKGKIKGEILSKDTWNFTKGWKDIERRLYIDTFLSQDCCTSNCSRKDLLKKCCSRCPNMQ